MLKDMMRCFARSFGFEIYRYIPARSHAAQLEAMLLHHGINLVFDVGANVGQFGRELRRHVRYSGRIVSFEPMQLAHAALQQVASGDDAWHVADRAALGAAEGYVEINVAGNSVSSSALPMLAAHEAAAPGSAYKAVERVRLTTLDAVALQHIRADTVAFLKIDTQGYESEVLRGGPRTLSKCVGLQLELSLVPLYEGQKLLSEMLAVVASMGFDLWAAVPAFADERSGRLLQVDATFFRRDSARE